MFDSIKDGYEQLKIVILGLIKEAEGMEGMSGEQKKAYVIKMIDQRVTLPAFWDDVINVDGLFLGMIINKLVDTWSIVSGGKFLPTTSVSAIAKVADLPVHALAKSVADIPQKGEALDAKTVDERLNQLFKEYNIYQEPKEEKPVAEPEAPPKEIVTPSKTIPKIIEAAPQSESENWARCLRLVLNHEGGYSDHAADRGGKTNLGITEGTLATAIALGIVPKMTVADMHGDDAAKIYHELYWKKAGCDTLKWYVCYLLFDTTVNGGIGMSARVFQKAMNEVFGAHLVVDGKWGPKTSKAIQDKFGLKAALDADKMGEFGTAYLKYRKSYYDNIILSNKSQSVFRNGWYNRMRNIAKDCGIKLPLGL